MLAFQYLLYGLAAAAIVAAAAILLFDVYLMTEYRRRLTLAYDEPLPIPRPIRWKPAMQLAGSAVILTLIAASIAIVPSGRAGVRVSQISGTLPGTLYPGVHFVKPLIESVALYDLRDQLYNTTADLTRKPAD